MAQLIFNELGKSNRVMMPRAADECNWIFMRFIKGFTEM